MDTHRESQQRHTTEKSFLPEKNEGRLRNFIAVLMALVLAIVVLELFVWQEVGRGTSSSLEGRLTSALRDAEGHLRNQVASLRSSAELLGRTPALENALNPALSASERAAATSLATEYLDTAIPLTNMIKFAVLFNAEGDIVADMGGMDRYRVSAYSWFDEVMEGKVRLSQDISPHTAKPTFHVAVPVVDKTGTVRGGVLATMNMETLNSQLAARTSYSEPLGVVLVNSLGTVVASSDYHYATSSVFNLDPEHDFLLHHPGIVKNFGKKIIIASEPMRDLGITMLVSGSADPLVQNTTPHWKLGLMVAGLLLCGALGSGLTTAHFRKREKALKKRASALMELSHLATWEYSKQDESHLMNSWFSSMLGRVEKDWHCTQPEFKKLLHPDDVIALKAAIAQHTGSEMHLNMKLRLKHKNGHWHWVDCNGFLDIDEAGGIRRGIGIVVDVHQEMLRDSFAHEYRSRLEREVSARTQDYQRNAEALRYERALLQAVIDSIPDFIWFRDSDKRLLGANRSYLEFFTLDLASILGTATHDPVYTSALNPETLAALDEQDNTVLQTGTILTVEERLTKADGSFMYLETVKTVMQDESGQCLGLVGVARDVTAHRDANLALERATLEAMAASKAKSRFMANMSQEVCTPLSDIRVLNAQILHLNPSEEICHCIKKANQRVAGLLAVTNDILDYSRMEAGDVTLRHAPFCPQQALTAVTDEVRAAATEQGLQLVLDVDDSVPARIWGDETRFRQIVFQLLSNAVKFTLNGFIRLHAQGITGRIPENTAADFSPDTPPATEGGSNLWLHVSVQDTGIGMKVEQLEGIFDPFAHAETPSPRQVGGAGIGLAIAKVLTKSMGGQIGVESQPGTGSRFFFSIPAQPADTTDAA